MDEFHWEEIWRFRPDLPKVGDYIQIWLQHVHTRERDYVEGFVLSVKSNGRIRLHKKRVHSWHWGIVAWRRRIVPQRWDDELLEPAKTIEEFMR